MNGTNAEGNSIQQSLSTNGKNTNWDNILKCAVNLFYTKGYDAVGVQEIVDLAGITKPTLYYYFKSKYGLLECLLEERCSRLINSIKEVVDKYNGDLPLTLYEVASRYMEFARGDKEFYFFMIALIYSARENEAYLAIRPYMTELYRLITEIFNKAACQLGNMNGRQRQFATCFIGVINHYILVFYETDVKDNDLNMDEEIRGIVHQFLHGIYS